MSYKRNLNLEKNLITAKLSKLREYQRFLKELQTTSLDGFVSDFKIRGAVERYFKFLSNVS